MARTKRYDVKKREGRTYNRKRQYLNDTDLSAKYDQDMKKCLRFRLFTQTKRELDVIRMRLGISIQDMFECFAKEVVAENNYLISMINDYKIKMKDKETQQLIEDFDADTFFNAIKDSSPL